MEKDLLYKLEKVDKIYEESEGDSDSELCKNCPCTDYGSGKNYSHTPNGYSSCEGSHCEEAMENIEDELTYEYQERKRELGMDKNAKMNVEIDLNVLEQNIVNMVTDKIEGIAVGNIENKVIRNIEKKISDKINTLVEGKVNELNIGNIYDVKTGIDGKEVKLFDLMLTKLIEDAKAKQIKFSNSINELMECVEYEKVDGEYNNDEFKVLTTITKGEYGEATGIEISVNGTSRVSFFEGEPEDMTLNRDLNDAFDITDLMKQAYIAGKSGKTMYMAEEENED